ncbi:Fatty acyl-CoA reductase 3 [Triticum urartu]|uniref:Fatty acyl-CoA reductase n=1 Tax=Triticum urartu TaxID=4572 RepID=M7YY78_TRIUA|nr:Fatty acyl-CoA reductase 3 [Triticum urartu]
MNDNLKKKKKITEHNSYDVALACNALGARNACQFAKKCLNMKLFLHVSTAYVAGTQDGLLLEKALQSGETLREGLFLDVEAELQLVENVKNDLAIVKKTDSSAPPEKSVMKKLGLERYTQFGYVMGRWVSILRRRSNTHPIS